MYNINISGTTHKLSKLRAILSTGSPLKPQSYDYVYRDIKKDVLLGSISGKTVCLTKEDVVEKDILFRLFNLEISVKIRKKSNHK